MSDWRTVLGSLVVLACWTGSALAADLDPPERYYPRDFYRPHHYRFAAIDPSGRWVASYVVEGSEAFLVVFDGVSMTRRSIVLGETDDEIALASLGWMDADSVIVQTTEERASNPLNDERRIRTFLVDVVEASGDHSFALEPHRVGIRGSIVSTRPDLDEVVLAHLDLDVRSVHEIVLRRHVLALEEVARFDASGKMVVRGEVGEETRVAELDGRPLFWGAGPGGEVQLSVAIDGRKVLVWYRPPEGGRWRRAMVFDSVRDLDEMVPVGLSEDGENIVVLSRRGGDRMSLYELDPESRKLGRLVFEHAHADVTSAIYAPGTAVVIGAVVREAGLPRSYYFRLPASSVDWLESRFAGKRVAVLSASLDQRQVVALVDGPRDPGSFYLLDLEARRMLLFGKAMPWIDSARMAEVRTLRVQSEGGPSVEAFLWLPSGIDPPGLVVMPHGGPIGVADGRGFDPDAQLLADRGHAVLKVNYRGSAGYGRAFEEAGLGQWGLGIEDDIDAAVREVVRQGLVREDRMCVVGASYGGYSALMMVLRFPGRFVCAGTIAGVSDLALMFSTSDWAADPSMRAAMRDIVGDPEAGYESLRRRSPVYHVEKIDVPILIVHGNQDQRVDIEHASRLRAMLELHDKSYKWIELKGENHWLTTESFIRTLAAVEVFVDDRFWELTLEEEARTGFEP